ncbi:hypothetical protein BH10PSE1_BH10PSE1_25560 [soil metagenome]
MLKPVIKSGADAHRQVMAGRGRGQRQAAWVRIWPAMVFSAADAVAA